MVQWPQGMRGSPGTRLGGSLQRGSSCCQVRGQGEVRMCLKLDTLWPHSYTCLRQKGKFLPPGIALEPPGSGLNGFSLALRQPSAPLGKIY